MEDTDTVGTQRFGYILSRRFLTIVEDGVGEELEKANSFFDNPKDAPVLVSAKQIPSIQFILSLDSGFFKPGIKKYVKPIEILKPGEFVERFRSKLG